VAGEAELQQQETLGRKKGDEQLFEGLQLSFEPLDAGG
jgi:hypothetical protein